MGVCMPVTDTINKPVFIVGYMHSGTTLLRNILSRHPNIYAIPGETKFFDQQALLRKRFPDLHDRVQYEGYVAYLLGRLREEPPCREAVRRACDALADCVQDERAHASVFLALIEAEADEAGKSYWLEKTPGHVYHIEEIAALLPDARFVEIVRDPRDVLSSKKTRRETVWTTDRYTAEERERKHLEKAYDPLWDTLSWKAALEAGQQAHHHLPSRILTVRYEDLVAHPAAETRRICAFLHLAFEPQMLDVPPGNTAVWQPGSRSQGLHATSVGRWRGVCKPVEIALCQCVGRSAMIQHQYMPVAISVTERMKVPVLLIQSAVELATRLYRRWRAQDTRYLINVLRNYGGRLLRLMRTP